MSDGRGQHDQERDVNTFERIRQQIVEDEGNAVMRASGCPPVYTAGPEARIAVVGQAPGRRAQASGVPWDDASGATLTDWLGVTAEQLRDPRLFALLPMDFYYPGPGRGGSGDAPPRRGFAARWHPPLLAQMPKIELTLLIGRHAQQHYLSQAGSKILTDTVRGYQRFLPAAFPLVHPSPLNFRWHAKNPWFIADVVPHLRRRVQAALGPPSITGPTGADGSTGL